MDIRAILKARGLDDTQAEGLISNPAYSSLLEAFVKEAEDGKTAYQKAQEVEQNLKTWNETQVVPYVRAADEKVAKREAELAAMRTHMKSLKDSGYDIPDAYLDASQAAPVTTKTETSGLTKDDFERFAFDKAKVDMSLITLANRHRKLVGDELDYDIEFPDFEANKRPNENLRGYIARKYDHDGIAKKVAAEADQKRLDDYAATKVQAAIAETKLKSGSNPETINPRSSRWDAVRTDDTRKQLWQTQAGRAKATQDRLQKYSDLLQ